MPRVTFSVDMEKVQRESTAGNWNPTYVLQNRGRCHRGVAYELRLNTSVLAWVTHKKICFGGKRGLREVSLNYRRYRRSRKGRTQGNK